jgi:protein-S-isoprenylcysteine O-methyltransferase Ste14
MNISPPVGGAPPWLLGYGNWLFTYRNKVFPLVLLGLFAVFRPGLAGGSYGLERLVDVLGLATALAGQALRAAVIGFAYIKRGGLNKRVHADTLVTEGFFAHARNPLYVGNLLILLGLFLIQHNPWVYVLGGGFFLLAYVAIVAAEEDYLYRRFSDQYTEYCRRVNRWVPDFRGLGQTMQGMRFNWRRVVLKDYASSYTWMLVAAALWLYATVLYPGLWPRGLPIGMAGFCTLAFAAAFGLKKGRILRETAAI